MENEHQDADHDLEEESDEVEQPLEHVVAELQFRVLELERQLQTLVDVVKPYKSRWWGDWSWQDVFGVGALALGPLALAWAISSNPQLASPALITLVIAGVAVIAWGLFSIVTGLLSKDQDRRSDAIFLGAMLILGAGLNGLIPVSSVSPTWQMPLWLAIVFVAIGGLGFFVSAKKR